MNPIRDLYIDGYRGIQQLELKQFSQINLIIGQNNLGKTSILESIELLSRPGDVSQFISTSRSRDRMTVMLSKNRLPVIDHVLWTFPIQSHLSFNQIIRNPIRLRANGKLGHSGYQNIEYTINYEQSSAFPTHEQIDKTMDIDDYDLALGEFEENRVLELYFSLKKDNIWEEEQSTITDNLRMSNQNTIQVAKVPSQKKSPLFKYKSVSPIDHRILPVSPTFITESIISGEENSIIQLLQQFDADIEGIELLAPSVNSTVPYFKHRTMGFVPITVYGDGVRRILTIATAMIRARNGLLLIDEVETAIHSKLLKKFFNWLVTNCKVYNIQLFITTHSLEAIDAILSADQAHLNEMTTYRLERSKDRDKTVAKRFIGEDMYALRYELGQDVR
ncbi:AAA family ATPase [Paenibacillus sp. SGZ-1009]|uniref:AAA family ATPase n=1 Tax=Paenibacillus campi TaxID=3106031 RepID=UPI002AFEABAC|nr:AAA family ATPase [Paenibacillus sp. SGZ-1009]